MKARRYRTRGYLGAFAGSAALSHAGALWATCGVRFATACANAYAFSCYDVRHLAVARVVKARLIHLRKCACADRRALLSLARVCSHPMMYCISLLRCVILPHAWMRDAAACASAFAPLRCASPCCAKMRCSSLLFAPWMTFLLRRIHAVRSSICGPACGIARLRRCVRRRFLLRRRGRRSYARPSECAYRRGSTASFGRWTAAAARGLRPS